MIHVSLDLGVPAPAVWSVVATPARWPEWGPSVTAVECPDLVVRAGSRGRVRTPLGVWVPFEVTRVETGRSWTWRVAGLPATDHLVEAIGRDRTRLEFGVPVWAAPYALVCRVALRRIAVLAAQWSPGAM